MSVSEYYDESFQSTHSRGVRRLFCVIMISTCNFNPRTHEECDYYLPKVTISAGDFNPRTHEECDDAVADDFKYGDDFNPRTHEECDRKHAIQAW